MYINIIWLLITVLASYFLIGKINSASEMGVLFLLLWGLVKYSNEFIIYFKKRKNEKLVITKKFLERSIIFVLLIVAASLFIFQHLPYFQSKLALHRMVKVYNQMSDKTLKQAEDQLKQHPNKMQFCALLMMPTLKGNDPKAIATYLIYYRFGEKYCNKWWYFGRNNCGYLKEHDYNGYPLTVMKNIKLCEISNSQNFSGKLNRAN